MFLGSNIHPIFESGLITLSISLLLKLLSPIILILKNEFVVSKPIRILAKVPEFPALRYFFLGALNEFKPLPKTKYSLFFFKIFTPSSFKHRMVDAISSASKTPLKREMPLH